MADPNYKISDADHVEQFDFLIKVRDKFSEIMKAIRNIREVRQQMNEFNTRMGKGIPKEIKAQIDTINKKMTAVEELLHQTKAKSGQDVLNFPIQLDDKLSSLYRAAGAGQSASSAQAKAAYAELSVLIDAQLSKLKKIMSDDVSKLNQMIHEKTLPVIGVKSESK